MIQGRGGAAQQDPTQRQDQNVPVPARLPAQKRENVVESLAVIQFHSGELKSMKRRIEPKGGGALVRMGARTHGFWGLFAAISPVTGTQASTDRHLSPRHHSQLDAPLFPGQEGVGVSASILQRKIT